MLLSLGLKAADFAFAAAEVARKCPVYALVEGVVLDTLFGPAEDLTYVSTTAPSSPPPTFA